MKKIISGYINILLVLAILAITMWNSFGNESFREFFNLNSIMPSTRTSFFVCLLLLLGLIVFKRKPKESQEKGFTRAINLSNDLFFILIVFGGFFIAITGYGF